MFNIPPPREGVLGILSDGDDQRIFLGLKFLILGFFWVRKIWQVFFWGGRDLGRDLWKCLGRVVV